MWSALCDNVGLGRSTAVEYSSVTVGLLDGRPATGLHCHAMVSAKSIPSRSRLSCMTNLQSHRDGAVPDQLSVNQPHSGTTDGLYAMTRDLVCRWGETR